MDVERLVETWRGPLTGLLAGWGAPWPDAVELAQDALVEAWLGRARLRGDADDPAVVGPWLRGIARHLHAARARRAHARREQELDAAPPAATAGPHVPGEDPRLEALRRAMARLPRADREVLYLYYLEETSVREAAGLLGVSEKALEGRLRRARERLRATLDPAQEAPRTRGPRA